MKVISIISQKGGAGKTTCTLNLAVAAMMQKGMSVGMVDLDPQGSLLKWGQLRDNQEPEIVSAQAVNLPNVIRAANNAGVDRLYIDTPPHSADSALQSAKCSDMIIVPVKASVIDLQALENTFDLSNVAKKQAYAVVNMAPATGTLSSDAMEGINDLGYDAAPVLIGNRAAFVRSFMYGQSILEFEPKGKGAAEMLALFDWIESVL